MKTADQPRLTELGRRAELTPANAIPGFIGRVSPYLPGVDQAGGGGYRLHFNTFVPWEYPENPAEQYRALTDRVVLWDTATLRQLQIKGKDAKAFTDYLVTRDVISLPPGRCAYTFVCDHQGIVICDPVVLVIDDETVWLSISGTDLILWASAIALQSSFSVDVSEVSGVAPLQLQGPRSREVLAKIVDRPIDDLRFFDCTLRKVAGIEAVVSRTGWSAELGYEIYPFGIPLFPAGSERAMQLWDSILEAGAEYGILVTPFQVARAYESGIMLFNHGHGEDMNALEFWRDTVVDFTGGDFIGKRALEAIRDSGGPARKMIGLIAIEPGELEPAAWSFR